MLVSKPTHGGGAPLGIDLDAGVAKIRIPSRPAPAAEPEPTDAETSDAESAAAELRDGAEPVEQDRSDGATS